MNALDLILFLVLLLLPLHSAWRYPKILKLLRGRDTRLRLKIYVQVMLLLFVFAGLVLLDWTVSGRNFSELGLSWPGDRNFYAALAVAVAIAVFLVFQVRGLALDPDSHEKVRTQLEKTLGSELLPRNQREFRVWVPLSVLAAGFCEELIYRAFLIWLVSQWAGVYVAIAVSAAMFGAGHIYQGFAGVLKTGLLGVLFALLYLLAGSLWPAVLLHAAIDIYAGALARTSGFAPATTD